MTGLLIKELLFRGVIKKVLIICPGGLTKQWAEEELLEKFGLYARLVNRASFDAEPGQFTRYEDGIFVTSIDFLARNEGCLRAAEDAQSSSSSMRRTSSLPTSTVRSSRRAAATRP